MIGVIWYQDGKASKVHATDATKTEIALGGVALACGRSAPAAGAAVYVSWTGRPVTCGRCVQARYAAPKKAEPDYLREVGWQRTSMYSGDPIGMPRQHLTEDNRRTCCGKKIPRFGEETREYRIDEYLGGRECEKCFTEKRKEWLRIHFR